MNTIHSSLGDKVGILLMEIAHNRFVEDLNPEGAIEAITSTSDISLEYAKDLVLGKTVIELDDNNTKFVIVPRDKEKHKDYPEEIDLPTFISNQTHNINSIGKSIYERLGDALTYIDETKGVYTLEIDFSYIFRYIQKEYVDFHNPFNSNEWFFTLDTAYNEAVNYLSKTDTLTNAFDFIKKTWPDTEIESDYLYYSQQIATILQIIAGSNLDRIHDYLKKNFVKTAVKDFLQSQKKIDETLKDIIKPVNIEDKYSAGWLSPEGLFFGLNGLTANLLHNRLADAICDRIKDKEGSIDMGEDDINTDGYLCRKGWIKISDNWILFDGYLQVRAGLPRIPITDAQIKQLVKLGNCCYEQTLYFGYDKNFCSTIRLESMDSCMRHKLFEYSPCKLT